MSELRKDPVVDRWVIIANDPVRSPAISPAPPVATSDRNCPFCPGSEHLCPPQIMAIRSQTHSPNDPGWSVRVVPNRAPVLVVEEDLRRMGEGLYDKITGIGANEVIIESPQHGIRQSQMEESALENVFWTYRDRILDLKRDMRLRYVLIYRNQGESAGGRLEHPYSLLTALPIIPTALTEELEGARKHFEYKERCIYCDIISQALHENSRVVAETKHFLAIEAFAPRLPFETWILPKRHNARYVNIEPGEVHDLAIIFRDVMGRIDAALLYPPYNYTIHAAPLDMECEEYYHWHMEILPRITTITGFELSSGLFINATAPEEAADFLRDTP